jgi:hypothetical protein
MFYERGRPMSNEGGEMEYDPVIAAALEYESATLDALEALDGTDSEAQIAACVRFVDTMQAMDAMPERDRGLSYLVQRGRIPDFAGSGYTPQWKSWPRTSARRFTEPPGWICRVGDRGSST